MKNIYFVLLLFSFQLVLGQLDSQPISAFTSFDDEKEILVDVRTAQEFTEGHLPNALNIDWFSNTFNEQVNALDKHKTIYVYCKKGGRSLKSQIRLKELGFTKVINLEGGYDKWKITQE